MGSRRTEENADKTYAAARQWVDCALRTDGSLFTPGKALWKRELLGELHSRFLDQPDKSEGDFFEKLEGQLSGSTAEIYQLMGEVMYVYFLILARAGDKKERIERVLGWAPTPVEIPSNLIDGLQSQFIDFGVGRTRMPSQVGTLIESIEQWKELEPDERERILHDPWEFKVFLFGRSFVSRLLVNNQNRGAIQKDILLHIVFPDSFETISARRKQEIVNANALARYITEPTEDIDRKIKQIRHALENELGRNFYFYDPDVRSNWDSRYGPLKPLDSNNIYGSINSGGQGGTNPSALKALAHKLTLPIEFLQETQTLLDDKKQVIFQGPPGTGKTYVARELAAFLAGSKERVTLVQFHPTYSYEDFVRGYRPTLVNRQAGFTLRDGPLVRAANAANRDKDNKHFLIIDEINRGNLAGVFGELYFLLEYRDEGISLQYSEEDEKFSLPDNLYIIGTMNTADRSIALVDLALRRRFYFVEFHPDDEPIDGLLRRWLIKNGLGGMEWVADVVDHANKLLRDDRHAAIGPSYFMKDDLHEAAVERIWKHSVLPYIEERLFGQDGRLGEFQLDMLRGRPQDDSGNAEKATVASESDTESDSGGE